MKKFFIHLGMPKTGTKFLQKNYFNNLSDYKYLGLPYNKKNLFIINKIKKTKIKKINNNFLNYIKKKIEYNYYSKFIISDEDFIFDKQFFLKKNKDHFKINNLYKILSQLGEVYFIITLRQYSEILQSFWIQIVRDNETKIFVKNNSKKSIIKSLQNKNNDNYFLELFKYGKIYRQLKRLTKNTHIIIYEDLKFNNNIFFKNLEKILLIKKKNIYRNNQNLLKKNNTTNKLRWLLAILIPTISNIKYSNINSFIKKLKYIKTRIYTLYLKNYFDIRFNFKKYDSYIKHFYKEDFEVLPSNIKKRMKKYNYN